MANKLTNIRRPVKRPNPVVLAPKDVTPTRNSFEDALHSIDLPDETGALQKRQYRIRPLTLKDISPVFQMGDELFSKVGLTLSRTWDEYEVVGAYSSDVEYSAVAELIPLDESSRNSGSGSENSTFYERCVRGADNFKFDDGKELDEDQKKFLKKKQQKKNKSRSALLGFILGYTIVRKKENLAYVSWIGVCPSTQRQGVGTIMLNWLEEKTSRDGCNKIIADTPDDNLPAIQFFEKHGYGNRIPQAFLWMTMSEKSGPSVPPENLSKGVKALEKEVEKHSEVDVSTQRDMQEVKDGEAQATMLGGSEETRKLREEVRDRIVVRLMEVQDLYPVFQLGRKSYTEDVFWEESEIVELFQTDADCCFVAIDQGKLIGFALGSTVDKKEGASKARYGYLIWMAVHKKYHRLGVGLLLYNQFHKEMEDSNVKAVLVDTTLNNKAALGFFNKLGFIQTASHYFYSKALQDLE